MSLVRVTVTKFLLEIVISEKNAESEEISFNKRPLHKFCFTSLKRLRYKRFCTTCKIIFEEYFVEDLYVFPRVRDW